ncbi:MAG: PEGA domain-containing protein [Acidobacteriia bacterium]|nr:PEGA domain-containing protein [Terriglobia bacterium]
MAEALTKAGRYQIVGELGRGSMGIVYQGFDPIIGRTVAIKTMLTEGLSPQEFQEYKARFQREAQAAGILTHPNIITVYDFGEDGGILFLAMEFLEGKSLEQVVQEQNVLPLETILPIYDQVCSALDHAHRNKIVHRDIKPANIMLLQNGLVKLTDFGIAKIMSLGMTQAGQILGTPNYMSPEQVKGRQVDGRSDIFSLGVILYELVTGEKPFGGQNITTVIYKIINENPIPPRELDGTIHAGLNYVISKALAKNSDERYQTCRELAEDLRNYRTLGGAPSPQGTVVLRTAPTAVGPAEPAPPMQEQAPQPPPVAVEETPVTRPPVIHVIRPTPPRPQGIPQIAWVLGSLLVVALLGGVGYFILLRGQGQRVVQPVTSQVVTEATPPAVTAQQATTPTQPTEAKSAEIPPIAEVARTQEPQRTHAPAAAKVGQLLVSANVAGAKISLDGRSDPSWVTPYTIARLPAGTYNVVISRDGYEDFQQSVTIEGGQTNSVVGNLSSPRGEINIETSPTGVEVLIDGKSYGPSPVRATLSAGDHTYTVKRPGAEPYEKTFTLKSGAILTKKLNLGEVTRTGIVEVRTIPPGATVLADGSPVGGQTPTSFRLAVGPHTLAISLSGYRPVQQHVDVSASGTSNININLTSQ